VHISSVVVLEARRVVGGVTIVVSVHGPNLGIVRSNPRDGVVYNVVLEQEIGAELRRVRILRISLNIGPIEIAVSRRYAKAVYNEEMEHEAARPTCSDDPKPLKPAILRIDEFDACATTTRKVDRHILDARILDVGSRIAPPCARALTRAEVWRHNG